MAMRGSTSTRLWLISLGMAWWWTAGSGRLEAAELPAAPLAKLASEKFQERELGEAELLAWGRLDPAVAVDGLLRHSKQAADPEVRARCLAVLRELVFDEFRQQGEGFIGIVMLDEMAKVPGDPALRGAIRVTEVVADSAAQQAGLKVNDLIVGLGDRVWHEPAISRAFSEEIREAKPNTRVRLKVLRQGELLDLEVKLGRRPLVPPTLFFGQPPPDPAAAEQAAKDAYFRRWLERRKP